MTSTLKTNTIEPEGATTNLAIGKSGQDIVVAGNDFRANTFKDAGGGAKYSAFTTAGSATWTCPTGVTSIEVLTVAGGGGGGGYYYAGGGGAGGIVHDSTYAVTAGVVYDITVGTGGTAGTGGGGRGWFRIRFRFLMSMRREVV